MIPTTSVFQFGLGPSNDNRISTNAAALHICLLCHTRQTDFLSRSPLLMLQLAIILSTALLAALIVVGFASWHNRRTGKAKILTSRAAPYTSLTYPILGSLQYFSGHWDFLRSATKEGTVSFHLARQQCIAVDVDKRQEFFSDSRPAFALAYAVMLGATPSMNRDFLMHMGFDITLGGRAVKFLAALLRNERVNASRHVLYQYAEESIGALEPITNPFDSIYRTVFRLTINTIAASSISANPAVCDALVKIFHELDRSGTPATILFPWFPWWERVRRFYLMKHFHDIMMVALAERRREGRDDEDPLQFLLDEGLSSLEITQFTLAALFAGIANTGVVAAYFLCDLASHPSYLALIRAEILSFIDSFHPDPTLPFSTRFHSITLDQWLNPSNLPLTHRCLKETLRLRIATPFHRLNDSGADMEFGGTVVPHGTILTFHSSFMHHNEAFYVDPMRWDPERFGVERAEDKGRPMAFAGWGLGKHQCLGQRLGKFEIFLITALAVCSYDMEVVEKDGTPMVEMPPVQLNDAVVSPPKRDVYLKLNARC
ncbi:cytochrome P450 6A1 [Favolaschia claudopus]|uniref:Cytochrome P450 6A1 n=1 Tax=Favolaschia claudopus TaxID=2862362 RepID=A0AAW0CBJ7_9AGAR